MSSMICPVCRTEFAGWAPRCSTCGVALVAAGERLDVLTLPEDQQVVYELLEWSLDQRAQLGELLAVEDVAHAWEDTDLIVAEFDEALVDRLCAEVEGIDPDAHDADDDGEGSGDSGGDDTDPDSAAADPEATEVTYELDVWSGEDRSRLERHLQAAGVTFSWEETTLIVDTTDEAAVDSAIDVIVPPEDPLPEASNEVLGELYVAADRLQHRAGDDEGLRRLTAVIDTVDGSSAPYGMAGPIWDGIVDAADSLADLLADGADEELIEQQAAELRGLVRPYV